MNFYENLGTKMIFYPIYFKFPTAGPVPQIILCVDKLESKREIMVAKQSSKTNPSKKKVAKQNLKKQSL